MTTPGLVVDLFAGGGGASAGIEAALGRPVDIAINHDRVALAAHKANHPRTRHLEADIWEVRPTDATGGRPVELLWASPDCFPAGTMILTSTGYRAIETIAVGDLVHTHRNRWRCVTARMETRKPVRTIRGHGHPGLKVSSEHPLFTLRRTRRWNNARRRYDWVLSKPGWMPARDLRKGDYWATPCNFEALPVPPVGGRGITVDAKLLWLAGRYVADGWTRLTEDRAELVICANPKERDDLRRRLALWPRKGARAVAEELAWYERGTRTEVQFATGHRGLVVWLRENFGHLSHLKRIPSWLYGMTLDQRRAFLAGYVSGDGYRHQDFYEADTVSPALAFGLRGLLSSLGYVAAMYRRPNRDVIEGRRVNAREIFKLRWRHDLDEDHSQVIDDAGPWLFTPIREVSEPYGIRTVYNLSVEEDESYVAEGVIVHNCTHFSVAKGNVPRKQKIRSLAWAVARWAAATKPRVIFVENVSEFRTWGPLGADGRPVKRRMGATFLRWKGKLESLGYRVEFTVLDAAEHGAPTRRRRLFIVARRDGKPVTWPAPTHGPGREPFHTAAECIDWALACPSIFERDRPLADKTLWRIAQGIKRFVLENPRPFIVKMRGEAHSSDSLEPLHTITAQGHGYGLLSPSLIKVNHGASGGRLEARGESIEAPLSTVTAARRGHGMVAATLVQTGYGEREGQAARVPHVDKPLGTIVAGGQKHAMVGAFLAKHFGGVVGQVVDQPASTITAKDHHSLAAATLVQFNHNNPPVDPRAPLPTITSNNHVAEVRAFLTTYYGAGSVGQRADVPLRTVTAKHRLGLVTIEGNDYEIVDIGMRMLEPEELLRAQFGRFAAGYDLSAAGTKSGKVRLIGNSVCPEVAEAVVRANVTTRQTEAVA